MMDRGRQVAPKGEAHGRAKLTDADVRTVRSTYISGSSEFGTRALARRFGVAHTLISMIVNRKIWSHA